MKIPKVHRLSSVDVDESQVIKVDIQPMEYSDDVYIFDDPKEYNRFVIKLKYYIRKSYEYTQMMSFLKKKRYMNCCGVHQNLKSWEGFAIQQHHTPFVMEDIIHTIIAKRIKHEECMKMSAIAREVMYVHYLGLVGIYPLCDTCHAYAHSDDSDLFIPLSAIYGDPIAFVDIYGEYMSDTLRTKFENIVQLNKGHTIITNTIPDELVRKYIYIDQEDGTSLPSTKKLYDFIVDLNP